MKKEMLIREKVKIKKNVKCLFSKHFLRIQT